MHHVNVFYPQWRGRQDPLSWNFTWFCVCGTQTWFARIGFYACQRIINDRLTEGWEKEQLYVKTTAAWHLTSGEIKLFSNQVWHVWYQKNIKLLMTRCRGKSKAPSLVATPLFYWGTTANGKKLLHAVWRLLHEYKNSKKISNYKAIVFLKCNLHFVINQPVVKKGYVKSFSQSSFGKKK